MPVQDSSQRHRLDQPRKRSLELEEAAQTRRILYDAHDSLEAAFRLTIADGATYERASIHIGTCDVSNHCVGMWGHSTSRNRIQNTSAHAF